MALTEVSRSPDLGRPSSARAILVDRHFEVREAIGELINAPTSPAGVEVQRAIHSFLAAEQALLAHDPGLGDGCELEREAQLRAAMEALSGATSRREILDSAEALRHRFLGLSRVYLTS